MVQHSLPATIIPLYTPSLCLSMTLLAENYWGKRWDTAGGYIAKKICSGARGAQLVSPFPRHRSGFSHCQQRRHMVVSLKGNFISGMECLLAGIIDLRPSNSRYSSCYPRKSHLFTGREVGGTWDHLPNANRSSSNDDGSSTLAI